MPRVRLGDCSTTVGVGGGDAVVGGGGPSPSGSYIGTYNGTSSTLTQLVDANGDVWTLVSGEVLRNGSVAGNVINAGAVAYVGGAIYHFSAPSSTWWRWNSGGFWEAASAPI
jgi:hypothetical protein